MSTVTPRASSTSLPATPTGRRFTLGTRIVCSFGAIFVLMLMMAAISYTRLRAIDDEATSLNRDSVPGLYYATSLRAVVGEGYRLVEEAIFVDGDANAMKRTLDRLPDALRHEDEALQRY